MKSQKPNKQVYDTMFKIFNTKNYCHQDIYQNNKASRECYRNKLMKHF